MTNRERRRLEKMLFYMLARRPDEFALLPDSEGFVRLKDLHRALIEVEGFKGVRLKQLRDLLLVFKPQALEFVEERELVRVRPEERDPSLFKRVLVEDPPPLLFTPVRPRAWIRVVTEGLASERIILTPDEGLAERMARRRGALIIRVETKYALELGAVFEVFIEKLYLSSWIPAQALRGPKVDEDFKRRYARRAKEKKEEPSLEPVSLPEPEIAFRKITKGRKKEPAWKKLRRQSRRHS